MSRLSPLERLRQAPHLFRFDAAARLLRLAAAGEETRFGAAAALSQPAVEVLKVSLPLADQPGAMTTPVIGLTGASGTMPRWYTELVAQAARARARGLADFFDLLAQRLISAFAAAAAKYRLHRSAEAARLPGAAEEPIGAGILALTGYGSPHLAPRLAAGADALRHYAGFFAARPRAADRLAAMVSDYLGRAVEIVEFSGAWTTIPPEQQTRLPRGRFPGAFHSLGADAAIGTRAWDQQARFIVRIGPLGRAEFEALLPDQKALAALVSLIRAYVGWEFDFAINLVLAVPEIPKLRLAAVSAEAAAEPAPRLGWTCWLPPASGPFSGKPQAGAAMFGAALVESLA